MIGWAHEALLREWLPAVKWIDKIVNCCAPVPASLLAQRSGVAETVAIIDS